MTQVYTTPTFSPGDEVQRGDLCLYFKDSEGQSVNVSEIGFEIVRVGDGDKERIGPADRKPVNPVLGEYYASLLVPPSAVPGDYLIRWVYVPKTGDPTHTVVTKFQVE